MDKLGGDMSDIVIDIKNLHVSVDGNEIIKGISMTIKTGEIHAIMGRNGADK